MRVLRVVCLVSIFCFAFLAASAQQSTPSSGPQTPQAASILQQAVTALTGGSPITDVTMTGTITMARTPIVPNGASTTATGVTTTAGTITYVATANGQGEAIVSFPSSTSTEIRSISGGTPTLIEVGTNGVSQAIQTQSAWSPHPAWFLPAFVLASGMSSPNYASSYIGPETWNGVAVQHVAVWLAPPSSAATGALSQLWQGASQHDIYLDPASFLPVAMTFTVHPYDPTNPDRALIPYRGNSLDRPEEVDFSDYQQIHGRPVALHLHSTMTLAIELVVTDIQISSVSFNTGATVAAN
jgi:hypothetical protein